MSIIRYEIMLSCWRTNPESRPLFDSLEKSLAKLLENGVAEHYIDLNEPYLKSNVSNLDGQTDYLALMAAPDCPAPLPPADLYVNGQVAGLFPPNSNAPTKPVSYLSMSPTINSPTQDGTDIHDGHFKFSSLNSPTTTNNLNASDQSIKFRSKMTDIPEEIPMLKRSNQSFHNSDSDTEVHVPDVTVHKTPEQSATRNNMNLLSTNGDNYVNVPSTIININKKDAVSNPGYVVVSNIDETTT